LHAERGHDRVAVGEHPEDHVEHASRRLERSVELDAAEQRHEETLDHAFRESGVTQHVDRRAVVAT
jgi:hypothetical protein